VQTDLGGAMRLGSELRLPRFDLTERSEDFTGHRAVGVDRDILDRHADIGGRALAAQHAGDDLLALLDAGSLNLGGFLDRRDIGFEPVHFGAHLLHPRFGGRGGAGDAGRHDRTECGLRHAIGGEGDGDRGDTGEDRLGPAGDAEPLEVATVMKDEITGREEIAEPRYQIRVECSADHKSPATTDTRQFAGTRLR